MSPNFLAARSQPSFSIEDFSDLVSSAFDISHSTTAPLSFPEHPDPTRQSFSSSFDSDDDEPTVRVPARSHSPTRPRTALDVLKQVRTRASAFVLRSHSHSARARDPHQTPRPSLSSQCTVIPVPTPDFRFGTASAPLTRHSDIAHRPEPFLPINEPRSAPPTSSKHGGSPSFLDDSSYRYRTPAPAFRRPSVPSETPIRIHARLPPLRKAQSFTTSLFSKASKKRPPPLFLAADCASIRGDNSRCPSPFTCPREAPPPPLPRDAAAVWQERDEMDELPVPDYVFARRGSSTSTNTTTSSKSTSSIASRIASIFPLSLAGKVRSRSKLNLTSTADSSLCSTESGGTWSPVTPTGSYHFHGPAPSIGPETYVFPETSDENEKAPRLSLADPRPRANTIGRVLTPEPDPFAKADIAMALPRRPSGTTPRPITPPGPCTTRRSDIPVSARGPYGHWDSMKVRGSMPSLPSPSSTYSFPPSYAIRSRRVDTPTPERYGSPFPRAVSHFSSPSCSSESDCDSQYSADVSMITSSPPSPVASRSSVSGSACEDLASRRSLDVQATPPPPPVPAKDRVLKRVTICASPCRNPFELGPPPPPRRSRTRASLPPSPRAQRMRPQRERAPSPFPLVRGVSDGSEKAKIRAAARVSAASEPPELPKVSSSSEQDDLEASPALDESGVLPSGFVKGFAKGKERPLSYIVDEVGVWDDMSTPIAESPVRLSRHSPRPSIDSTGTVMLTPPPATDYFSFRPDEESLRSVYSTPLQMPASSEHDQLCDGRTARPGLFYSARSSIGSSVSL